MRGKALLILLLLASPLFAGSREGLAIQELRLDLDQVTYKSHGHQVEIDILHEKIQNLDKSIGELKRELSKSYREERLEKRLHALEKNHEAVIGDLKLLREKINDSASRIASLDKQLSQDVKSLKSSLQSMLALLKGEESGLKTYTVQEGDSLGKIAQKHRLSIPRLKELNNLTSDRIYAGQKLQLPVE